MAKEKSSRWIILLALVAVGLAITTSAIVIDLYLELKETLEVNKGFETRIASLRSDIIIIEELLNESSKSLGLCLDNTRECEGDLIITRFMRESEIIAGITKGEPEVAIQKSKGNPPSYKGGPK